MLSRFAVLAALATCLLACVEIDPGQEGNNFDPPSEDGGVPDSSPVDEPPSPDAPVLDCTGETNYTLCELTDAETGVCVFGACVRSCREDSECADSDPCTDDECRWGHCVNRTVC